MGATSSGIMRSSAGYRYSAVISLYSAHTGAIEGLLLYDFDFVLIRPRVAIFWCR